jgi:hypothetical protein
MVDRQLLGDDDLHASAGQPASPPSPPTTSEHRQCLSKLAGRIDRGTVIHMPRIGCGLAGGTWDQIEPFLEEHLVSTGFDVRVYDLPAA